MITILQDYNPHILAEKIKEYTQPKSPWKLITVTVGPDNGPEHQVSAEVYTAWLSL